MAIRLGNFWPNSEDFVLQIEIIPKQLGNFLGLAPVKSETHKKGKTSATLACAVLSINSTVSTGRILTDCRGRLIC